MKVNRKIIVLIVGVATLLIFGMVVTFWSFWQLEDSTRTRRQTTSVLKKADELLTGLIDAETSMRGYLLTGDETFLQPYLAVRESFGGRQQELRFLTLDSTTYKHLDALAPLVTARMALIEQAVEYYRTGDQDAALALVRSGDGKRLMDAIRVEINSIIEIETGVLASREAQFETNMRFMFLVIIVASLLILMLSISFVNMAYREAQQRLKNEIHLETQQFLETEQALNVQLMQTNMSLQISEEKLAVTLNSIGDAVIATDAIGLVALMNPLAEKLTGWPRAQGIGRPVNDIFRIINEETRHFVSAPVAETLAHGTLHGLANHTILIGRDNSECSIADSCAPIRDRDGLVVGAVLVFRDVTERTRLDHLLLEKNVELESARSVAEKANQAKSDFLSSMSHELRSPLNAILGFAQLMESETPPPTPQQLQSIEQISQAGWHLLKLINEVLDLTKIESGQVPLSPEPVSLAEIMHECKSMIEPQAQQHGVKLNFPSFETPIYVRADRTRLKQVLINLLSNAIKYNIHSGKVEVICSPGVEGRIRVSIKDTGAGLSQAQLAQLFQAFNRLGQEASGIEGTGIGLVVARRLVELMGGTIGVESSVGNGSLFWFELIAVGIPQFSSEVEYAATITTENEPVHVGGWLHTLLYIEDNPANLKLVEQIIARRPDIRLLSAVNGVNGIEIAREVRPDVVLMDINLPDISGFEALQILGSDRATSHIPIIAISANAMPRDIKKGLQAGFFRYITKPIKINEFMEAVNLALEFVKNKSD
jgi:PAS domain S-box-containing protein